MKKKRCTKCKVRKSFENFSKHKHGKFGLKSKCKSCNADAAARRYAASFTRPAKKPNLKSWQPLPGDKFDAYLGHNLCELGPFVCVKNGPDKVAASTEEDIWQLDKAEFVFLEINSAQSIVGQSQVR